MNRFTKIFLQQIIAGAIHSSIAIVVLTILSITLGGVADDMYDDAYNNVMAYSDETLKQEALKSLDSIKFTTTIIKFMPIVFAIIISMTFILRSISVKTILTLRNTEIRMAKLKKMGVEKFIKYTKATLVDSNDKGYEMYESKTIIKDKSVRFVIYRDTSTTEQYISFVRPEHTTVDEAMAWKQHLTVDQYKRMELES